MMPSFDLMNPFNNFLGSNQSDENDTQISKELNLNQPSGLIGGFFVSFKK